jgi:UDPglucose--hexose-1-phosphate uridylyltransferase
MPELRRHYFLDEYCIIATERGRRPTDFRRDEAKPGDEAACPFCPGNEGMTPPSDAVYTGQGILSEGAERVSGWQMRVFPNAFPAVVSSPETVRRDAAGEWMALPGQGFHEVIVDSPLHRENPADFSQEHMERLIRVYRDRYLHYTQSSLAKYVSIFKNWGREAGASCSHSHSQIVTLPIIPPQIKRERDAFRRVSRCPFCNIVEKETGSARLVGENDGWILIAPFYSQMPFETWILPKRHFSSLGEMNDADAKSLAPLLMQALRGLRSVLNDPPYNLMIFQLPSGYHLNIRIQPAVSRIAGFEKSTGIHINFIAPEYAAARLSESAKSDGRSPKS